MAARLGGDTPDNFRLTSLVAKANSQNCPKKIIDAAVARGADPKAAVGEDRSYEGHGPGGCSVLVEANTDNPRRTAPNLRKIFSDYEGNMGDNGSVAWIFNSSVELKVDRDVVDFDDLLDIAADLGAEDVIEYSNGEDEGDEAEEVQCHRVLCEDSKVAQTVHRALKEKALPVVRIEFLKTPSVYVELEEEKLEVFEGLVHTLLEHGDVVRLHTNVDGVPTTIEAS